MLDKDYKPGEIEEDLKKAWDENGVYKFERDSKKEIYSIDTPPPTVSGAMHLGHAFSYSQMDFIARYKRMRGYNIFYPFGTDDNGLPTERLVEKLNDVKATGMDRIAFIDLCMETIKKIRPGFIQGWKDIGISADWTLNYSTIDDHSRRISQESFIELYNLGREYRMENPFMWCPNCQTAIAQVELEDKESKSSFNDIVFKLEGEKDLIISTTRPEMLPACVAIFAHPDDERFQKHFGKKARVPIFNQEVPIMPDRRADPEKGTGVVMCCTFGDQTDIEWYMEHRLPLKEAITKDGRMTALAGDYTGMEIKAARKKIITDLKNEGLLINSKNIVHPVNVHERCGTEIEILNTKQWFIKYLDLRDEYLEAGKKINWHPDHMRNRYENWIKGLRWDWCISRQRYFGVPFPVWYCQECGEVMLAEKDQLPVDPLKDKPRPPCKKCGSLEFIPEKDVLDTWATSSLTPQLAIGLIDDPEQKARLYPFSLRPQAHDIITFWLFNTVVKGLFHHNEIPWHNTIISGWALDPQGKKMSKSKGNVVEPKEVLEKYSADALRFWASGSNLGDDLPYNEKDLVTAKKFLTKMWNAAKFTTMHLQDYKGGKPGDLDPLDLWILSKLGKIIKQSTELFEDYRYSKVRKLVSHFFLRDFCDNYLEMVKFRLYNPDEYGPQSKLAAQYTLYQILLGSIKLMAPFIPFITEEIFLSYFQEIENGTSIHNSSWPVAGYLPRDKDALAHGETAVNIISAIRRFKAENKFPLNHEVKKAIINGDDSSIKPLTGYEESIRGAMNIKELEITSESMNGEERVVEIIPDYKILGPKFKSDANLIIEYLKNVDKDKFNSEISRGNVIVNINGNEFEIMPDFIKEIRKEVTIHGERIDTVPIPEESEINIFLVLRK